MLNGIFYFESGAADARAQPLHCVVIANVARRKSASVVISFKMNLNSKIFTFARDFSDHI